MRAPLVLAVAQPAVTAHDVAANAAAHAQAVLGARARVVAFPELSLTGYELDAAPVDPSDPVLAPLVEACARTGSIALAGAPVREDGHDHIAVLRVDGGGAAVCYRKLFLGAEEAVRFTPGPGPVVLVVDGVRLGLGVCKDTGTAAQIEATAALGVDVYVAGLVHHPEELAEQEARAARIAATCGAHVAFASCAGPTGGGYDRTAGHSGVWSPDGTVLAEATDRPGEVVRATV